MLHRLALKFDHEMPGIEAFVTDDTGFAKKGQYSVGVARQYSGTLGRTDNCQVAVSLHLAGARGSGCIAMRLYLPEEEWVSDKKRRAAAGVFVHGQSRDASAPTALLDHAHQREHARNHTQRS